MKGSELQARAVRCLQLASYSPKKLLLIHVAASVVLNLAVSGFGLAVGQGVAGTGGLGGIGLRASLETVEAMLLILGQLLLPFWEIGFTLTVVQMLRGRDAVPGTLLGGFRRFGPVLRLNLLLGVIYAAVLFAGGQVGSTLFMLTPAGGELMELSEKLAAGGITEPNELMNQEQMLSLTLKMLPFVGGGMLLLFLPVAYRLRLSELVLMDHPDRGAFWALVVSLRLMRGKVWQFVKLDLRFWWFYGLWLLTAVICWGDLLLGAAGVELGMSADVAAFVFLALGLLAQLGLFVWKKDVVAMTYAMAYDGLLPKEEE